MATIEKLPSGNFRARVYLPNGKRKTVAVDKRKSIVEKLAREYEVKLAHGPAVQMHDRKLTVTDWHARWDRARRVEPNTAAKNASHWKNHIKPQWGDWPLASIDRLDVQTWVNDMDAAGVGASTIAAAYNLLSKMLSDAVLSQKIHASPCVEISLPTVVPPAERWLTHHEYDRIQLALANRMLQVPHKGAHKTLTPDPLAPMWQAFVALGCYSGLRCPGELSGLDIEHLDFDRNLVRVQQVMTRHGMKDYPKTGVGAQRWVPFPEDVGRLLWRWVGDRGSGPVFTGARGDRVTELAIRRVWRGALEEAGIDYVDPYSMRHTCASWLAQAGVSTDEIADLLGHSSTRMTKVYRHMRPDAHDRVRAAWTAQDVDRAVHVQPTPENEESPRPSGRGL